jgi:hypothetical protein
MRLVEIFRDQFVALINIRYLQQAWPEVGELVWQCGGAHQCPPGLNLDFFSASCELRTPCSDDERLVIGLGVQVRAFADLSHSKLQDGDIGSNVYALKMSMPQSVARYPIRTVNITAARVMFSPFRIPWCIALGRLRRTSSLSELQPD